MKLMKLEIFTKNDVAGHANPNCLWVRLSQHADILKATLEREAETQKRHDARIEVLEAERDKLREALKRTANELEDEINANYPPFC